jgi:hypothetical protein
MLALNEVGNQDVEKLKVFFGPGETPRITDRAGVFWTSPHTHDLPQGDWTSGSAQRVDRYVVASIPAAAAVVCRNVGKHTFMIVGYSPSVDTSNTIEYVRELKRHLHPSGALRRRATGVLERFVVKIRSDNPISIGELHEKFQRRQPINQDLAARQRALLDRAGGGLTTTEVAQRLNVPQQEVDELRTAGRLLAVPDPDGSGWTYPACQFEGPRVLPGLPEVLSDFAVESPWTRLYVLIGEDPALEGRTPFEALKNGDLEMVREIVSGYGRQGGD